MPSALFAVLAAATSLLLMAPPAHARDAAGSEAVQMIELEDGLTLRRSVVRRSANLPPLLLLHGFPETLLAWQGMTAQLAGEFEIHAFDWPGFGQSERPASGFDYSPRAYARVLQNYIAASKIDRTRLVIYATDIGALPALLAALDDPQIAKLIVVGDFAPLDRPHYMQERLQRLKTAEGNAQVRDAFNASRAEILANAMYRGLSPEEKFELAPGLRSDMEAGWDYGSMTSADAFARYYANFTRDQTCLEKRIAALRTPVKVIWGEKDFYISPAMGEEFARLVGSDISILPGIGHYPHLQDPGKTAISIRAALP